MLYIFQAIGEELGYDTENTVHVKSWWYRGRQPFSQADDSAFFKCMVKKITNKTANNDMMKRITWCRPTRLFMVLVLSKKHTRYAEDHKQHSTNNKTQTTNNDMLKEMI